MEMTTPDGWLRLLHEIADEADALALKHFRSARLKVETKADASPVSEADRGIETIARRLLAERHPDVGILGEEEGESAGAGGVRLIVDPIDATKNFVRGIPIFATLLAVEVEGDVVAGVVSAPALGSRWYASRGHGAYRDRRRIHVSTVASLADAQVFHPGLKNAHSEFMPPGWAAVLRKAARTRGFGDFYQHVLVAEGAGELAIDPKVKPWDIAPLIVILEEAGGRATSLAGERSLDAGSLLISNGLVHDEALALMANAVAGPGLTC